MAAELYGQQRFLLCVVQIMPARRAGSESSYGEILVTRTSARAQQDSGRRKQPELCLITTEHRLAKFEEK